MIRYEEVVGNDVAHTTKSDTRTGRMIQPLGDCLSEFDSAFLSYRSPMLTGVQDTSLNGKDEDATW